MPSISNLAMPCTVPQSTPALISFGIAVWKTHGDKLDDLIGYADKMMYQQKQGK